MSRNFHIFFLIVSLIGGCASEIVRQSAQIEPADIAKTNVKTVQVGAQPKFSSGYSRRIEAGSTWKLIGYLPEGEVYAPINTAFNVVGAHAHEAYLVVNKGRLVGFYLPVEKAWSALTGQAIQLWEA